MVMELAVINHSVDFLQSVPTFGYEFHRLLVPAVELPLPEEMSNERKRRIGKRSRKRIEEEEEKSKNEMKNRRTR